MQWVDESGLVCHSVVNLLEFVMDMLATMFHDILEGLVYSQI